MCQACRATAGGAAPLLVAPHHRQMQKREDIGKHHDYKHTN
jgi:hypothetical protein